MRISRIYVEQELVSGTEISLAGAEFNYLRNVLRLAVDNELVLFNGDGFEYSARVVGLEKRNISIAIEACDAVDRESSLAIHLLLAVTKGDRMDFSIQKAVELGVQQISPIFTRYGAVSLKGERLEKKRQHWARVAISAAEQCGRNIITPVHSSRDLEDALAQLDGDGDGRVVFAPNADIRLGDMGRPQSALVMAIGPEGGFSDQELDIFARHQFVRAGLGPRILRAETAVVAAVGVAQSIWGDL